jgi:rhodanese-related sulfurtransferase
MAKSVKFGIILLIVLVLLIISHSIVQTPAIIASPSLVISPQQAKAERFGLIIDVRTSKERETLGYYPESVPIPIDQLSKEVPSLIFSKTTRILIYSNGDDRAKRAAIYLYQMGYSNVKYITTSYLKMMPGSS